MSATPPRFASSFSSSASMAMRSFDGSRSSCPSAFRRRRSWRCSTRSESVRQFVSSPPSQRWLTYGMPTRLACSCDRVLRLLLRADEEHGALAARRCSDERVRLLEQSEGLGEVDDVDAAALAEDESLHLRVPAARLMAEVDSGLQEVLHRDDGHGKCSLRGFCCTTPADSAREPARAAGTALRDPSAGSTYLVVGC